MHKTLIISHLHYSVIAPKVCTATPKPLSLFNKKQMTMNEKNNKDASLGMRVSTADKKRIFKLAKQSGLTVSEYVARTATAQVADNDEAIKAFMATDAELTLLNTWFNGNCEMMSRNGYVLAPDVKQAWAKFMDALTEQVATTFTAKMEQRRTTLSN